MSNLRLGKTKPLIVVFRINGQDGDLDKMLVGTEEVELLKEALPREFRVDLGPGDLISLEYCLADFQCFLEFCEDRCLC